MAQFDYFATWSDDWDFLAELSTTKAFMFLLDKAYESPKPVYYQEFNDEMKRDILESHRRMYLVPSSTGGVHRSAFEKMNTPENGVYYWINVVKVGEVLDLSMPACFQQDGMTCLNSGILVCQPDSYDHSSRSMRRTSDELKASFQAVRKILKRHLVTYDTGRSKIWIGRDALQLIEAGKAKIIARGV